MAYKFVDEEPTGAVPSAPDFWLTRTERIFQLMTSDPVFVNYGSVIEDPKRAVFGLDTNDPIPDQQSLRFTRPEPVAVMRYESEDLNVRGFVVDMRYAEITIKRELDFENMDDDESTNPFKTVPPLGLIFIDPETSLLSFRSEHRKSEHLMSFVESFMHYVDNERARRGGRVIAGNSDSEPKPAVSTANLNIEFSAQNGESTPSDTD